MDKAAGGNTEKNSKTYTPMEILTVVRELGSAASTQARIANRYWLTMVGFGLITLDPRNRDPLVQLFPWIAKIPEDPYFLMAFGVFSVLATVFASAHVQQIRADNLAHRTMDGAKIRNCTILGTHPKDLYDAMRRPSIIRVSPLPQLLQGKESQYLGDNFPISKHKEIFTRYFYIILKFISIMIYLVLPLAGLLWMYWKFVRPATGWYTLIVEFVGIVAVVSLLFVIFYEIKELRSKSAHLANNRGEFRGK